jgi:pilus assembly protein Flp/PilA
VRGFVSDAAGATAIEYGLLVALMSLAIITALTSMGTSVNGTLANIASTIR